MMNASLYAECWINDFLFYETEHEFLLRENLFEEEWEDENDGSDCLLLRTAGLKLYLMLAWTSSSLKISIILLFSFAEQSTKPHCQSILTIDSTTSFVTHQQLSGKSTLLQTTTIGTFGPRLLIICIDGESKKKNYSSEFEYHKTFSAYLLTQLWHFIPWFFIIHWEH